MGFAVYATKDYEIESPVDVTLYFEGEEYQSTVVVKASIPRRDGIRYGVYHADDTTSGSSFKNALGKITMAIQRQQLARVSRRE